MHIHDLIQIVPCLLSFLDAKDCARFICSQKINDKNLVISIQFYNKFKRHFCDTLEVSLEKIYLTFQYNEIKTIQN